MMVRAFRDLRKGEEILIDYTGDPFETKKSRKGKWKMNCDCEWCQEEKATRKQEMDIRKENYKCAAQQTPGRLGSEELKRHIRNIEATYEPKDRFRPFLIIPVLN